MKVSIVLVCCLVSAVCGAGVKLDPAPKQWALLVAGSNGYYNYRHQADVCHSYQILHRHGIPDEQIVVMMYDDIANNKQNPFPGRVYNTETGPDQYAGVLKDYVKDDVTPENFMNILLGNAEAMKNIGSGKVIDSGPHDNVFVYFADHGGTGLIAFPNGELSAHDLIKTLKSMHDQNKYKKLVFYMEACDSGSMFKGLLPDSWNIYATTAANATISSWACDCPDETNTTRESRANKIGACLNDCYSVNWLTDSDRVHLKDETLAEQFQYVKNLARLQISGKGGESPEPEVCKEFGDLNLGRTHKLSEFMGSKTSSKHYFVAPSFGPTLDSRKVEKHYLKFHNKQTELAQLEDDEKLFTSTFQNLIRRVLSRLHMERRLYFALKHQPNGITDTLCHKYMLEMFSQTCGDLAKRAHTLKYHYVFENLCRLGNQGNMIRRHLIHETGVVLQEVCKPAN